MRLRIETQEHWERRRLALLPAQWAGRVGELFRSRGRVDYLSANEFLRDSTEPFEHLRIPLDATDADVRAIAARQAADMFALACSVPVSDTVTVRRMLSRAVMRAGIRPPEGSTITDAGAVARMTNAQWWRRQLRRVHGRELEAAAIGFGFVHRGAQCYASDQTVARRQQQKRRNADVLSETIAINEAGDEFTLAELVERSVANPTIRRGELMTRIRGFEEVAAGLGHAADFWTVTCPSRMHPKRVGGVGVEDNPVFDGTNPREAQQYLGRVWGRIRAALARKGMSVYGFRIAEPHHDGTPHWHLLMFFPVAHRDDIRAVVRRYALADSPGEPGADEHRFKAKSIEAEAGTAAGYVAKYVAKNIDGYMVETDLFGNEAITASHRVEAWAATWGIRQFQPVGGPPVGIWRELRRIPKVRVDIDSGETLAAARDAADAGDWRGYVMANGGPIRRRRDRPLQMEYGPARTINPKTGEVSQSMTRYGEPAPDRPVGVWEVWSGRIARAVRHVWEIVTRAGAKLLSARTRVNNCTGVGDGDAGNATGGNAPGGDGGGGSGGADQLGGGADARSDDGGAVCRADIAGAARGRCGIARTVPADSGKSSGGLNNAAFA